MDLNLHVRFYFAMSVSLEPSVLTISIKKDNSSQGTLYTAHRIHCTQHTGYTVHSTQGTHRVHCTQHTGYTIHSTQDTLYTAHRVHCTGYTVHSTQGTLYTTHRVHCTQHTGYTVHNTQGTLYTTHRIYHSVHESNRGTGQMVIPFCLRFRGS